jgi:hypothetical protein
MQNAAGGGISDHPNRGGNSYQAIVSDLGSLIEHMQASMKLIESAIAGEAPLGNREIAPGVIELDDVTPRYVRTNAALETCTAGLAVALHFLLDTSVSTHGPGEHTGVDRRPLRLIDCA